MFLSGSVENYFSGRCPSGRDRQGLTFIPPHLAQEVCETSVPVRTRDDFMAARLKVKKYLPGEIYGAIWTEAIWKDFKEYLDSRTDFTLAQCKEIYDYPGMHADRGGRKK